MRLLHDLEAAMKLVRYCEGVPEVTKARMNFIVNLVTILEIHSRNSLCYNFDDGFLEGSFTYNTISTLVVNEGLKKNMLLEMIRIRNKIIHEGQTIIIRFDQINAYYDLVKSLISERVPTN